jgi:hypothetical protein
MFEFIFLSNLFELLQILEVWTLIWIDLEINWIEIDNCHR